MGIQLKSSGRAVLSPLKWLTGTSQNAPLALGRSGQHQRQARAPHTALLLTQSPAEKEEPAVS